MVKRSYIYLAAGEYLVAALSFVIVKITLTAFGIDAVAAWAQLLSFASIVQSVFIFNLSDYQVKRLLVNHKSQSSEVKNLFLQELAARCLVSLPLILLLYLLAPVLGFLGLSLSLDLRSPLYLASFIYLLCTDLSVFPSLLRARSLWTGLMYYNLGASSLKVLILLASFRLNVSYIAYLLISALATLSFSIFPLFLVVKPVSWRAVKIAFRRLIPRRIASGYVRIAKSLPWSSSFGISIFSFLKALPVFLILSISARVSSDLVVLVSLLLSISAALSKPYGLLVRQSFNDQIYTQYASIRSHAGRRLGFRFLSVIRLGVAGKGRLFLLFAAAIFLFLYLLSPQVILLLTSHKIAIHHSFLPSILLSLAILADHFCSCGRVLLVAETLFLSREQFSTSTLSPPRSLFLSLDELYPYLLSLILVVFIGLAGFAYLCYPIFNQALVDRHSNSLEFILIILVLLKLGILVGMSSRLGKAAL